MFGLPTLVAVHTSTHVAEVSTYCLVALLGAGALVRAAAAVRALRAPLRALLPMLLVVMLPLALASPFMVGVVI